MIVYMHCDSDCRTTAYGFKSSRSASNFIISRMKELAAFQKKKPTSYYGEFYGGSSGSTQDALPQHILTDIEKIAISAKGNAETVAATLQKAIDLYEETIAKPSVSHSIRVVSIVS